MATNAEMEKKGMMAKVCEWCGRKYTVPASRRGVAKRRLCSNSCRAKWRMAQPGRRELARQTIKKAHKARRGRKRPNIAERMRKNNPILKEETRVKVSRTLKKIGHKPTIQGGNGRPIPLPQRIIMLSFRWKIEYISFH